MKVNYDKQSFLVIKGQDGKYCDEWDPIFC